MIQEIRRLRSAKPFEPFTVHAADGEAYDVGHPEYISQTPSGRLILIGLDDDSTVTLDLLVVTGIRKPARRAKRKWARRIAGRVRERGVADDQSGPARAEKAGRVR